MPTVIFGAGRFGKRVAQILHSENVPILCFLDMDQYWHEGKTVTVDGREIECLNGKQLVKVRQPFTMITKKIEYLTPAGVQADFPQCTYAAFMEARAMTKEFLQENAAIYRKIYSELQDEESRDVMEAYLYARYTGDIDPLCSMNRWETETYDFELLQLSREDIVVDGGAYTGDTIEGMSQYLGTLPKKVFAFEPDSSNAAKLQANFSAARDRVSVVNAGLYDHDGVMHFSAWGTSGSTIDEKGAASIEIQALDMHPEYADTTVIKMDIEGSELKALQGAKELLRAQKPRLAICIYHKNEDLAEIYKYLSVFGYKFYLRQHANRMEETVLYAI